MNISTGAYIQAIRGPVLLVTVGVLFAIHQAGILSFSRTWPLLIIVIGVMKLLERAVAPQQPVPNLPSGSYQPPASSPYVSQTGSGVPPGNSGGSHT